MKSGSNISSSRSSLRSRSLRRFQYAAILIILAGAAFFAGREAGSLSGDKTTAVGFLREPTSYQFISPLLSVSVGDKADFPELKPLQNQLSDAVAHAISNGDAASAAVYFQNFTNGHWTGVNENDGYDPASLLKVPIMMAAFRQADANPSFLLQNVVYQPPAADLQQYGFESLVSGNTYTIEDLISAMITDSDNGAKDSLGGFVNANVLQQTFTYLNLPPLSATSSYTISPRQYSRFFRILYNATYLNQDTSDKALALLSQTDFDQGIVAGVASGTVVSHKFGQYAEIMNGISQNPELHDCGIVYYPGNPYFLCVMTRGGALPRLENVIATISKITYQEVKNGYK